MELANPGIEFRGGGKGTGYKVQGTRHKAQERYKIQGTRKAQGIKWKKSTRYKLEMPSEAKDIDMNFIKDFSL
jgi:hypothetical protein